MTKKFNGTKNLLDKSHKPLSSYSNKLKLKIVKRI